MRQTQQPGKAEQRLQQQAAQVLTSSGRAVLVLAEAATAPKTLQGLPLAPAQPLKMQQTIQRHWRGQQSSWL